MLAASERLLARRYGVSASEYLLLRCSVVLANASLIVLVSVAALVLAVAVSFLSKALFDACKNNNNNTIRERIIKTAKSMASKDSRYCKTCEKVKELDDFRDESLKTKYGNVCNSCRKPRSNFWRYRRYRRRW